MSFVVVVYLFCCCFCCQVNVNHKFEVKTADSSDVAIYVSGHEFHSS